MSLFSISELGRFSGLKPHTIRAWEARYKALTPARSQGNTRYYDSGQMKRLLNLATLVNAGYLPSEVGRLTDERLHQLLESVAESRHSATEDYFISQLIVAGLTYDQARFEQVFSHCLARYRLKNTYAYILLPMLERIGLLWRCEKASPAQEHFVSNLLRQKLFAAVDRVAVAEPGAERWLLFLPENEFHEMGLLLAYCLVRIAGHQAVYLGCNVPFSSLPAAIKQIQPDRLLMFTVNADLSRSLVGFLKDMDLGFTGKKIYVAGRLGKEGGSGGWRRTQWLGTVEELTTVLTESER